MLVLKVDSTLTSTMDVFGAPKVYTQFADAQSTSTKDRVYAQIEARGGDSVEARTVVAARTRF